MADVQSRPATRGGRGGGRAGRGGYSSRGGGRSTSTRHTNGDATALDSAENTVSLDDQGELGKLKKQYLTETVTLKEMFPDWTDDDLVFALQETDGDLPTTIERISEGIYSRPHYILTLSAGSVLTFLQVTFRVSQTSRRRPKRGASPRLPMPLLHLPTSPSVPFVVEVEEASRALAEVVAVAAIAEPEVELVVVASVPLALALLHPPRLLPPGKHQPTPPPLVGLTRPPPQPLDGTKPSIPLQAMAWLTLRPPLRQRIFLLQTSLRPLAHGGQLRKGL